MQPCALLCFTQCLEIMFVLRGLLHHNPSMQDCIIFHTFACEMSSPLLNPWITSVVTATTITHVRNNRLKIK